MYYQGIEMDKIGQVLLIVVVIIAIALLLSAVFNVFPLNQIERLAAFANTPQS